MLGLEADSVKFTLNKTEYTLDLIALREEKFMQKINTRGSAYKEVTKNKKYLRLMIYSFLDLLTLLQIA